MRNRLTIFIGLWLLFNAAIIQAQPAAIASAHPLATEAGLLTLQRGGNAFDAAVAVSAALAVVEPAGSGMGGGGFWLLHDASSQHTTMIDGREMAPGAAHRDMYLDKHGVADPLLSLNGPLAAGIPGQPAALVYIAEHYGNLPLSVSLKPAIELAENGFKISEHYRQLAQFRLAIMKRYPATRDIFLSDGKAPAPGTLLRQPDLANTLKRLARFGHDGFYRGATAVKLVESVRRHGGIWTLDDLAHYRVKERQPVTGLYQGYQITSAALPSSGGIVMMLALNQLKQFDLKALPLAQQRHLVIESLRRAYRDRGIYLGDSDFINVPAYLVQESYARQISKNIDPNLASVSAAIAPTPAKGENTTHFSIIDKNGNRVAATLSVNYPFGSGFVAKGTGVLLNNEMDDFSAQPGAMNVYGLIGNEANAIAPYKRPLSSMSPTFVENDNELLITGTPGGSRIISMVLLSVLDFIDGKSVTDIVAAPRYHHQYLPDEVQVESVGFSTEELDDLRQRGHKVNILNRQYGDMHIIQVNKNTGQTEAASDPRGEGLAIVRQLQ